MADLPSGLPDCFALLREAGIADPTTEDGAGLVVITIEYIRRASIAQQILPLLQLFAELHARTIRTERALLKAQARVQAFEHEARVRADTDVN